MEDMFFLNLLLRSTLASVKYEMIINENIESSHNKEEKNSLFTTISVLRVSPVLSLLSTL